jgi:uncharacterized protein (TIGR02466 family)
VRVRVSLGAPDLTLIMKTIRIDHLFPTPIYRSEVEDKDVCPRYAKLILDMMTDENWKTVERRRHYSTYDRLHKMEEFKEIVDIINDHAYEYFENHIGLARSSLDLCAMWANVHSDGFKHHIHNHQNSFMSGVLYLDVPTSGEIGDIFFVDPRAAKNMQVGDFTKSSPLSDKSWIYKPTTHTLMIFPSWLEHGTSEFINKDNEYRICIGFNFRLTTCNEPAASF